jgi:hypothetical protein
MRKIGRVALLLLLASPLARSPLAATADIQGQWTVEFSTGDGVHNEDDMQMYVSQDGSRLTGHIEWNSSATDYPLKGTITDDRFEILWSTSVNGVISEIRFRGAIKGEELNGTVEIAGHEPGDMYARRIGL